MKIQAVSGETLQLAEVEVYGPDAHPGMKYEELGQKNLFLFDLSVDSVFKVCRFFADFLLHQQCWQAQPS